MNDEELKEEYYTIDYNNKDIIIYGGNKHEIYVNNIKYNEIINIFNDFTESVIYLKYINSIHFYAVSLNGEVCLYDIEKGLIESTDLEIEITSYYFIKINEKINYLILGSINGTIYLFFEGIKYKCFYGHISEIFQVEYLDSKIYSLSSERFIIFEIENNKKEYIMESYLLTCFFLISSTVYLIGSEKNLRIYKKDRLLKKIDNIFSCFIKTIDGVLCGGEKLIEIGFNNGITIFDYQLKNLKIFNMKLINNQLIISNNKDIGIGDIRNGIIEWLELNLGEIFDFIVFNYNEEKRICLVGESGLNILEL